MNITKKSLPFVACGALALTLSGCIDETDPISNITPEQVEAMSSSQEAMLNGILAFTNDLNTYHGTGDYAYYLNDWGYPCQMYYRDVLTADFPLHDGAGYAYWQYAEQSLNLNAESTYTYNYYYQFIKNCNGLIEKIDTTSATSTSLNYLGCALTFRALCYLDMARLYEYQPTGYSFDADATDVYGLTVPIATEKTTEAELRNKERAPFYEMYRFILTDLTNAEKCLDGYKRPNGNYPDQSVVYGMMARFWLEVATRFDKTPADLTTMMEHDGESEDGYVSLGVTSALECYQNASKYAKLAEEGYTPMTEDEWTNPETGFNTATAGWMLYCSISTMEQEGYYYSNWSGSLCTEATWGMPQIGNCYREIGSALYDQINRYDWRKQSWIDPDDAGNDPGTKYKLQSWSETDDDGNVTTSSDKFKSYPAYANLKMRPRSATDYITGMYCDTPMMRVEEMYFIDAEATAHIDGIAAGITKLQNFMNNYRCSTGRYTCPTSASSSINGFTTELLVQKRIEFWGEGLTFFDMKRLKKAVLRSANTNYGDDYLQDSKDDYVSPTMNLFIPEYAKELNTGLVLSPNCTGWDDEN